MIVLWIISGIVGGLLLISAFIWLNNNLIVTTRYNIAANIESPLNIVQITDLHGKSFGKNNVKLLKKIKGLNPDAVFITGDIIHKYRQPDIAVALSFVCACRALAPVIYVAGNHEMRSKRYRFLRKDLMEAGAAVLDNCSLDMLGFTVTGLNCASLKNGTDKKIFPQNDNFKILLAHMPQFIDGFSETGYDLVFCGHAHGGQWRIPFTKIGIYAPGQGLFPALTSGLHKRGKTQMIISRGLGNSECPVRLFNPPEIVCAHIEKEKKACE